MRLMCHPQIPSLIPGVEYKQTISVSCVDALGRSSPIRVLVGTAKSSLPTLSAIGECCECEYTCVQVVV